MERTLKFLKGAGVFYVATVDGDKPRVRPFGALCRHKDRLYICTNNKKDCYKQMINNSNIEISAMNDKAWIRVSGKIAKDDSEDARKVMLENNPILKGTYKSNDGLFEVLYFKEGVSKFYCFGKEPEEEKL
ncbi:pyridoxamine 5'-phosphate oxidase family protein [candidate division WOR-3 bacterium]|nr:pyridoxamine 5'-phosphate oxidase family protein [candidate division WOR-3 bacterium]